MQRRFRWISVFGLMMAAVIISTFSVQATQSDTASVRCNMSQIAGQIDTGAPYMRIEVALASDLSQILATKVINVHRNGTYSANLNYERQAENTLLIVSIGQWDGQNYISPASLSSYYCTQTGGNSPIEATPTQIPPTGPIVVTGEACYYWPFASYMGAYAGAQGVILPNDLGITVQMFAQPGLPSDTVAYLSAGSNFTILDGPYCSYYDELGEQVSSRRWFIEVDGLMGWVEEYADLTLSGQGFLFFFTTDPDGNATPAPSPMPSEAAEYYIAYFSSDQYYISAGACITLSYWVVGAQSITLQASNSSAEPEAIFDNPNQRVICPSAADYYVPGEAVTYTLNVVYLNGLQDSAYVSVQDDADYPATPMPTPGN
jgi:hypothetical protein